MLRPLRDVLDLIVFVVGFCAVLVGCFGFSILGPGAAVPVWGGVVM
jgi:hypothetical protein